MTHGARQRVLTRYLRSGRGRTTVHPHRGIESGADRGGCPHTLRVDFAFARPGSRGHLALINGVPVGMTWIEHGDHGYYAIREGHAELASLFLVPAMIGTGAGRTLFWHALEALAQEGYRDSCLMTYAPNVRARGFYEAMNWREDRPRRVREFTWEGDPFSATLLMYRGPTRPAGGGG